MLIQLRIRRTCLEKTILDRQTGPVVKSYNDLNSVSSVSPENAVEIESTYKPSAGTIGRAFIKAIDFFKERILRLNNKVKDADMWKYDWQHATVGQDWRPLTKMHESGFRAEKIANKVKRFLARDSAKIRVGDRYELRLTAVDRNHSGYYRCVNKHGRRVVSMMYFIDVVSRVNMQMASPWSDCNKCGEEIGEQARSIQCMIQPIVPLSHLHEKSNWIKLFGSVPCDSTLVPLELRKTFARSTKFVQYRPCWVETMVDRNLTSVDELGEVRVLDYIPKGEFLFGEILPRLLAPVVRKNYLVRQTNPVVFTCEMPVDEPGGVQWFSKKKGAINYRTGRFSFDETSRLYISSAELEDSDEYFCYTTDKVLMGVHVIRVLENDRTRETVENLRMFFRFAAFTFIFVLIVGQVMK
ncbi:unnamed protein product [Angiostrongylus costaricensis]|uniref:Ig-like domain-containing protein n=1 Tax=Angiostrongylus costaricensis TaxID=334426 RepID=A0A3P7HIN9_ANGCS|nr:unnamed protein product [Angiostrongylus costaricensis]